MASDRVSAGPAALVLALISLMSLAAASGSGSFKIDESGGAEFELEGAVYSYFDEGSVSFSADDDWAVLQTRIKDSTLARIPDFSASMSVGKGQSSGNAAISEPEDMAAYGPFSFRMEMETKDDSFSLNLSGRCTKEFVSDIMGLDWYYINASRQNFIDGINEALDIIEREFNNSISADLGFFNMSVGEGRDIEFAIGIRGRGLSNLAADIYKMLSEEAICGRRGASSMLPALSSGGSAVLEASGDGESIAISFNGSMADTTGETSISYTKEGDIFESRESGPSEELLDYLGCYMSMGFENYDMRTFELTLSKKIGSPEAVFSASGSIEQLAVRSGGKWEASFPADMTGEMSLSAKIPKGFSIISVEGGEKSGERSAISNPGEEFRVVYAKAEGDYTIWIIAAVLILLLIAAAKRKK